MRELEINSKAHVKHMQRLLDMAKDGTFKYAGRDNQPDQLLVSGKAGIHFNSSGMRGDMVKSAKFDWGEALLPYDPELIKAAAEFDHRRREPVDDDGARAGRRRNTRRSPRSCSSSAGPRTTPTGTSTPAMCR